MCSHVVDVAVRAGATRSRGRVQPAEEAARSVGGVQLRVPIGQAFLESAGLRGQALGQGLLAEVSVSEMAQGVSPNVVQ